MNERIRELVAQATRIEEPDGLFPREVFDQEKFAELIVRECARVGFDAAYPYKGVLVLKAIKERFGLDQ